MDFVNASSELKYLFSLNHWECTKEYLLFYLQLETFLKVDDISIF